MFGFGMRKRVEKAQIEENKRAVAYARERGMYVVPPPGRIVDTSGYSSSTTEGWQQYIEENKRG